MSDLPTMDETEEKPDAAAARLRPPAYQLADDQNRAAEEESRESDQKAAFVLASATGTAKGKEKPGMKSATVTGEGGPALRSAQENAANPLDGLGDTSNAPFATDIRGKGWIRCRDGKMIRDDGCSIHVPGYKPTQAQIEMVLQLSMEKGWTRLYAFNPNGRTLNPVVTQMLAAVINATGAGLSCCTDQKHAGRLNRHLGAAADAIRNTQITRHELQKQQAAAPAPAPQPA